MMFATNTFVSIPVHLENLWETFKKDPFSDQSVDFARLIAAYYLGFPLLAPRNPGSLPSLYEWPKSSSGKLRLCQQLIHMKLRFSISS